MLGQGKVFCVERFSCQNQPHCGVLLFSFVRSRIRDMFRIIITARVRVGARVRVRVRVWCLFLSCQHQPHCGVHLFNLIRASVRFSVRD